RGGAVLLKEVFAEATERAATKIRESPTNASWPDEKVKAVAPIVGIGALVFANLMSQRDKDVDFEWEDVLSTSGDSGAYVQYAYARCCRTIEKSGHAASINADVSLLRHDVEWAL